jgi:hypothetical protein
MRVVVVTYPRVKWCGMSGSGRRLKVRSNIVSRDRALRHDRRRSLRGTVWRVLRGVDKNIYKIHNGRIHVKV